MLISEKITKGFLGVSILSLKIIKIIKDPGSHPTQISYIRHSKKEQESRWNTISEK
jgi:hypothetical protein